MFVLHMHAVDDFYLNITAFWLHDRHSTDRHDVRKSILYDCKLWYIIYLYRYWKSTILGENLLVDNVRIMKNKYQRCQILMLITEAYELSQ